MNKITLKKDNVPRKPPNVVPRVDSRPHENDGKRLRRIRNELGLTQKQLAFALGCTARTVGNYERAVSEIPQSVRRLVFDLTSVDIVPPHCAEEDPDLVVKRYHEIQRSTDIAKSLAQFGVKPTWIARCKRFRAMSIYRNQHQLAPIRRIYESSVTFVYLLATTIFGMEQIQRGFGGWEQNQSYHDMLLVGSFVTLLFSVLPVLQIIPWGTKVGAK